jgi:hypothetical protein
MGQWVTIGQKWVNEPFFGRNGTMGQVGHPLYIGVNHVNHISFTPKALSTS